MEKVFLDKFKGFLRLIIPCLGFVLPLELKDGLTSGDEYGNESADVL